MINLILSLDNSVYKFQINNKKEYVIKTGKEDCLRDLEYKKYWIWLSLIKNLGNKRKRILLEKYQTPEIIYYLTKKELLQISGIGDLLAENILDENIKNNIYKHMDYMQKQQIDIISIVDKEYPKILKEIYDPPISLYIKGNKDILNNKSIAIIGCREATEYGKNVAKYFAYNLANKNLNIVSGLAKGVDSYAHIGTLSANGKTIAVVGNGLDNVYPKENLDLWNKILKKGGTIISEYPLGTKPQKMNFPARNRIISGMSKGIVVIEAKKKSGTLITVDFALDQGRDVYVVPGNINSINSAGTNELIKQGAKIVTTYQEIEI